jgi:hypothetical protein
MLPSFEYKKELRKHDGGGHDGSPNTSPLGRRGFSRCVDPSYRRIEVSPGPLQEEEDRRHPLVHVELLAQAHTVTLTVAREKLDSFRT